jgi:ribosomal protein S18 acetylase RimI-like enzyme
VAVGQIRPAQLGDVDAVVALNAELFREDAGPRDPFMDQSWPQREGRAYFTGVLTDRHCCCFLALDDDAPVGYLAGRMRDASSVRPVRIAELESIYVQQGYRSQGLGDRLAQAFLHWASAQRADRAEVVAYAANEPALRFYRRIGFEPKSVALEIGVEPHSSPTR